MRLASYNYELLPVPAGSFTMGSPIGERGRFDDEPEHVVRLSRPYLLGRTEVTRGLWAAVMGPIDTSRDEPGQRPLSDDLPMTEVSWSAAIDFCNRLSEREGLAQVYRVVQGDPLRGEPSLTVTLDPQADGFRLPTEAEWEHAARAGSALPFGGYEEPGPTGWFSGNAQGALHPVATRAANPWGLHDMVGNAWELVQDAPGSYAADDALDPTGPGDGAARVVRGGSWQLETRAVRVAMRGWLHASFREPTVGFRLARTLMPAASD